MNDLEFPEVEILRKKVRQKRKDVERYEHYPNVLFNRKRPNTTLSVVLNPYN